MTQLDHIRAALFTSLGLLPLACAGQATPLDADQNPPLGNETPPARTDETANDDQPVVSIDDTERDDQPLRPPPARLDPVTIQSACSVESPFMADQLPAQLGNQSPVLTGGIATGLSLCDNGILHRREPVQCQSFLPRFVPSIDAGLASDGSAPLPPDLSPNAAQLAGSQVIALYGDAGQWLSGRQAANWWHSVWSVDCTSDADCTQAPLGYCAPVYRGGLQSYDIACKYGCLSDSDCGDGQLCECGDPVGRCVDATCRSDADCAGGFGCAVWFGPVLCAMDHHYSCRTREDECVTGADCESRTCTGESGTRRCFTEPTGVCGRPFLVAGDARTASLEPGSDWCAGGGNAPALPAPTALHVGEHWAKAALLEHASIAAFARFTLQLMHLGAPRQLVEQSQRAMLDETEHATLCFAQAARFLGSSVQPGALPMFDALADMDLETITRTTFLEGCVGETLAALEAREARAAAADPEIGEALDQIAQDELRHAELAFQFVRWALTREPRALPQLLEGELSRLEAELHTSDRPPAVTIDAAAAQYGVLPASVRASLRRAVIADIVLPCTRALLARARDVTAAPAPDAMRA